MFLAANGLLVWAALSAGEFVARGEGLTRRLLATVVALPTVAVVVLLALGVAGRFEARWALLSVAAVSLMAAALRAGHWWPPRGRRSPPWPVVGASPEDGPLLPVAVGLLAAVCALYAGYAALLGGTFAPDDLSYHAVLPADWIVHGRLTLGIGNYQAYYPCSAELLAAWFMLPFHDDRFASLTTPLWAAMAVVSLLVLARAYGASRAGAVVVALLFVVAAPVLRRLNTFSAVDLAGPAAVLAACALLAPRRDEDGRERPLDWRAVLPAGLAAGLAAGSKASFLPVIPLLILWLLPRLIAGERLGPARALARAGLLLLGAVLTGGYWYIRNTALTGNPLFPFQLGPLPGPFGPADQAPTKLASYLGSPAGLAILPGYVLDWPIPLFLVAATGYGAACWALARRPEVEAGARRWHAALVGGMGLALLALFPFSPFSGTTEWVGAPVTATCRYVLASFGLGIALVALALRPSPRQRAWTAVLLATSAASLALTVLREGRLAAAGTVGALVVVGLPAALLARRPERRWPSWLGLAACGLAALFLLGYAPLKAERTDAAFARSVTRADRGGGALPMDGLLAALESLPAGSRVAWFSEKPAFCYWAYGRRLQLEPTPVDVDGLPLPPLHIRSRRPWTGDWWVLAGSLQPPARAEADLAANLRLGGIEYVITTRWLGSGWPAQEEQLACSAGLPEVFRDAGSAIRRLR